MRIDYETLPYKVRMAVVDSSMVHNWLEPKEKRTNGSSYYKAIESSIIEEGFRNPIIVQVLDPLVAEFNAKFQPYDRGMGQRWILYKDPAKRLGLWGSEERIIVCNSHGGSRLWVAHRHELTVPCVVTDFCGAFEHVRPAQSSSEILAYFKDQPRGGIVFDTDRVQTPGLPQSHMPHG